MSSSFTKFRFFRYKVEISPGFNENCSQFPHNSATFQFFSLKDTRLSSIHHESASIYRSPIIYSGEFPVVFFAFVLKDTFQRHPTRAIFTLQMSQAIKKTVKFKPHLRPTATRFFPESLHSSACSS